MKAKQDESVQVTVFMGWAWLIGTFICSQPIFSDILEWLGYSDSEILMYQSFGAILFGVTAFMSSDGMRWLSGHTYIKRVVVLVCNAIVYVLFLLYFFLLKVTYVISDSSTEKYSAIKSTKILFQKYEKCPCIAKGIIAAVSICTILQILIKLYYDTHYRVIVVTTHAATSIISILGLVCALNDMRNICVKTFGTSVENEKTDCFIGQ